MTRSGADPEEIDRRLSSWRQGDAVIDDEFPFLHLADLRAPLTPQAEELAKQVPDGNPYAAVFTNVCGFVVLSQTCDIVLPSRDRRTVEIAALEKIQTDEMRDVKRGQTFRRVFIPALETSLIVANPHFIMTMEKSILALIDDARRIHGVTNDVDALEFARRIARCFERFAFPDEFVKAMGPIKNWLQRKHGKQSPEGRFCDSIREIRVSCDTSWNGRHPFVTLIFMFERSEEITTEAKSLADQLAQKFQPTGQFIEKPNFRLQTYENMTARNYLETVPLELNHLSLR